MALALLLATAPAAHAELSAWGSNSEDALCDGHTSAEQPYSQKYVKSSELAPSAIAGGEGFVVFVSAGKLYACGAGLYGTLGREGPAPSPTPVEVALPESAVQVAAGAHFALALTSGGAVYEWGCTFGCQAEATYKGTVRRLAGLVANSITAGPDWAAASLENGTVVTWGSAQSQDCTPTHYEEAQPQELYGASEVAQVAAAMEDLYMLTRSGEVLSCGPNDAGSLGDGSEAYEPGVHRVTGLIGVREVAATRLTGYAATGASELFAWGWPAGDVPVAADSSIWPVGGIATARENVQALTSAAGIAHGLAAWGGEANLSGFNPPAEPEGAGSTLTATATVVGPGYFDDYAGAGAPPAPKSRGVFEPEASPPAQAPQTTALAPSPAAPGPVASATAVTGSGRARPHAAASKRASPHRACRRRGHSRKCKPARRRRRRRQAHRHVHRHGRRPAKRKRG